MNIRTILQISRPRFWLYTTGPYFIGLLFAIQSFDQLLDPLALFYLFYFLFLGNYLIYGVNDLSDYETDKQNPKKKLKEYLLQTKDITFIHLSLWVIFGFSISLLFLQPNTLSAILLALFLFFSLGYSLKPIRFKAKPFLDSFSNILYVLPGFLAYTQFTGQLPPWYIIIGATTWSAAMHLYSAIPDILYDTKAKIQTTATYLGRQMSFFFCSFLWFSTAILLFSLGLYSLYLLWVYPLIPILHLAFRKLDEKKVYWYFPFITYTIGFLVSIEYMYFSLY